MGVTDGDTGRANCKETTKRKSERREPVEGTHTQVHECTRLTGQEQDGNFKRLWREGGGVQTVRRMGVQGARQKLGVKCRET